MVARLTCPQTGEPCSNLIEACFDRSQEAALAAAAEAARDEVREQAEKFALRTDVDELKAYVAAARGRSSAAIIVAIVGLIVTFALGVFSLMVAR